MQVERKYEQWKAITESDFVTLFIKTWFTFIALARMNKRQGVKEKWKTKKKLWCN